MIEPTALVKPSLSLAQRLSEWVIERMFGPKHHRKLERIRNAAITNAAKAQFPDAPNDGRTQHLESVLGQILPSGVELASQDTTRRTTLLAMDLVDQLVRFDNLDPDTMGVSLSVVVEDVLNRFFAALRTEAERSGSVLLGLAVVEGIETLKLQIETVASIVGAASPSSAADRERVRILAHDGWLETVRSLYPGHAPVCLFGSDWPMAVVPAPESQWADLESPLGKLTGAEIPLHTAYPADCYPAGVTDFQDLQRRAKTNKHIWNGPTFALDALKLKPGGAQLSCKVGRYFPMAVSCDSLEKELMDRLSGDPDAVVPLDELPRRLWAHENCGGQDPLVSGLGRSAAVSVATTILMATPAGGWRILLAPRSPEVAAHAFFNHVLPSGIFQPLDWHDARLLDEYSVEKNILREYSEELFNNEDLQRGPEFGPSIYEEGEVQRLLAERGQHGALQLYYTGISLNLLTMRPEICALILVNDPDWYDRERGAAKRAGKPMLPGWEVLKKEDEHLLPRNYTLELDLDGQFEPMHAAGNAAVQPGALVGNAAASIYLALKVARKLTT